MRWLAALVLVAALGTVGDGYAQQPPAAQCPELPFFVLVPFNYPCILHPRVCRTDYGLCRLEAGVNPGAPCACRAYNGMWLQGICIR
jgi:hypothetical protein